MSDDRSRNYNEYEHAPSTSGVNTRHSNSPEIFNRGSINRLDSTNDKIQEIARRSVTPSNTTKTNKKKTSKSDSNSSGIKVIRCSEQSPNNVDAAISNAENVLKSSKKKGNKSRDENTSIRKNTHKVTSRIVNYGSSSSRMETDIDMDTGNTNINSSVDIGEESTDSLDSTSTTTVVPKLVISTPKTKNRVKRNSNSLLSSNSFCDFILTKSEDTASITFPSILENCDPAYKYVVSDRRIQDFIKNAKMMEPDNVLHAFDPTEIEEIINDEIILGTHYYLVKWKKWSRGFNTWERYGALYNSQKLLLKYIENKKTDEHTNRSKYVNGIELMMSRKIISMIFDLFRTETGLCLPGILPEVLTGVLNSHDDGPIRKQTLKLHTLQNYLTTISLGHFRQQQLIKLQKWEFDINSVTPGYQIKVENNIDLEGPPDLFAYITNYIPQTNIIIPDDPPIGCSCRRNCQSPEECCYEMSGCLKAYDKNKNIVVPPGNPVFECNKKCICTNACSNRVVQLGSNVNICIYKTRKYGWGIKSSQDIPKGQFVGKYIGEIITVEESEQRLKKGSSLLDNMWSLDFDDSQNYKYIIDGTHFANFTYFINHSCDANLNVYAVWINCLDRNLPELALFASRDISAGEQLTTDYFSRGNQDSLKKNGTKCQCDMKNCQGYYF
ncbi:histone-lysine N-methyltransferase SUV39H2-like isoform X2 [Metopolophium dirhodum]|uniref:histone-lysine N-methyltransferase SUV39H2-like isoform X2 n=1 Tax=Metopolophium dirhodum TaxID=44670 RepID=UPI00298F8A8C|nr:histone-lysine N-methyltransferase SUV39H2-like isoform X2 [Metopolophium dirhodum]